MNKFISGLSLFILIVLCAACGNTKKTDDQTSVQPVNTPKELQELNEKIKTDSTNAALYYARAKYKINIREFNDALVDMSYVMKYDSVRPEYYLTISDLYLSGNNTRRSKEALEKCLVIDPKNTEAMLKLAELYFYVKKYQESIDNINNALKINEHIAKAYFLKGMNYKEIGDTTKAISSMNTATEQDPEYYAAYMELGALHAAKKNALALSYYDNAIRIDPKSVEAVYGKGKFYQDIKDWNNAIKMYGELLKMKPDYKYAHYNLGAIALVNKRVDDAITYFTKAIADDAKYPEAYFARGTSYVQKGDKAKAREDYKMAVELNPNYEAAQDALAEIGK